MIEKYSPYIRAFGWGIVGIILSLLSRKFLSTSNYSQELGSISNIIALFGVLFGLLLAFVVFEAWKQFTDLGNSIIQEATGCERLFRTYRYLRDSKKEAEFKKVVISYLNCIVEDNFESNATGKRSPKASTAFREISHSINDIDFNDDHDSVVFGQLLDDYSDLSEVRNTRIGQATTRLPDILKGLVELLLIVVQGMVVIMPFNNTLYQAYFSFALFFFLGLLRFLILDLDNPFKGYWNQTTDEYKRVIGSLEKNYND
ncbi:MAG: DUF4239 domain-containing protein [Candidatus Saccharibacteria bacterium]|nr:DUF4239 domain-containing protein [Candidatus Saccharibacteria bacterium]